MSRLARRRMAGRALRRIAGTSPALARHQVDAFRDGLRELGCVDERNVAIEERWAEGKPARADHVLE